jgi:ribonuclease BN (tRNA processing enzyme)
MRIRVLGASGAEAPGQRPSAFLVNRTTLVDAGSVTGALGVAEQCEVENVLVSHSHLDHIGGLAFLTETLAFDDRTRPIVVSSLDPVVTAVRDGFFNNTLWTDFSRIPAGRPVVEYRVLADGVEEPVGDLRVTAVRVDHTVPAAGFVIHDGETGFVYSGDTGPTDALWAAARRVPHVRAVILECSFPSRMDELACVAKHFTPDLVARELPKLPPGAPVWIFHLKPQFRDETVAELRRIDGRRIVVLEQDQVLEI